MHRAISESAGMAASKTAVDNQNCRCPTRIVRDLLPANSTCCSPQDIEGVTIMTALSLPDLDLTTALQEFLWVSSIPNFPSAIHMIRIRRRWHQLIPILSIHHWTVRSSSRTSTINRESVLVTGPPNLRDARKRWHRRPRAYRGLVLWHP